MLISRQTTPFYNSDFYKLFTSDSGYDPITDDNFHILIGNSNGKLCLIIKKLLNDQYLKFSRTIYLNDIKINGEHVFNYFQPCIDNTIQKIHNNIMATVGKSGKRIENYTFLIAFISHKNEIVLIEIDYFGHVLNHVNFVDAGDTSIGKVHPKKTNLTLIRGRNLVDNKLNTYFIVNGFDEDIDDLEEEYALEGYWKNLDPGPPTYTQDPGVLHFRLSWRVLRQTCTLKEFIDMMKEHLIVKIYLIEIGSIENNSHGTIKKVNYHSSIIADRTSLISHDFDLRWFLELYQDKELSEDFDSVFSNLSTLHAPELYTTTFFVDDQYIYSGNLMEIALFLNSNTLISNHYLGAFTLNYQNGKLLYTGGEPSEVYYMIHSKGNYVLDDPEELYNQGNSNAHKEIFVDSDLEQIIPTVHPGRIIDGSFMNMKIKTSIFSIGPFKFQLAHDNRKAYFNGESNMIYRDLEEKAERVFI